MPAVNAQQRLLDGAGSLVDAAFLTIPAVLLPFADGRKPDVEAYQQDLAFYIAHGFCDHPHTFFQQPENMPEPVVIQRQPYSDGMMEVISWPSGYVPQNPSLRTHWERFEANKTGYLVRWHHRKKNNKTVLCLHGFMLGEPMQAERMFRVRNLFDKGLDVALFITPFHWLRAPSQLAARGAFLQPHDVCMTAEAIGQTMWDMHIAVHLLKQSGAQQIGLVGASLGGFNAALFCCLSDMPAFCALMVPAFKFPMPFGNPILRKFSNMPDHILAQARQVWDFTSPLNFKPKISRDKILIVASRGDLLCPWKHTRQLATQWAVTKNVFLTGGHWLMFDRKARGRAWYQLLADCGFIPSQAYQGSLKK